MLISSIRNLWPFATIALGALSPSASASPYTGPADPTAYRKPEALICMGIAGSPKGLRLDFGATDSIGNLSDGYAMVSLDGAIGVHYLQFMHLTAPNTLEGRYTHLGGLNGSVQHGPVICRVTQWFR